MSVFGHLLKGFLPAVEYFCHIHLTGGNAGISNTQKQTSLLMLYERVQKKSFCLRLICMPQVYSWKGNCQERNTYNIICLLKRYPKSCFIFRLSVILSGQATVVLKHFCLFIRHEGISNRAALMRRICLQRSSFGYNSGM